MNNDLLLHTAKTNLLTELNRDNWSPANIRLIVRRLSRPVKIELTAFNPYRKKQIDKLLHIVCRLNNVSKANLFSKTRKSQVIYSRQLCMFVMVNDFKQTLDKSGGLFGLDHTTAIHARRKIQGWIDVGDKQTIEDLKLIKEYLK